MSSTLIVRILNEIDNHVCAYNEWAEDLRVVMNHQTMCDLMADVNLWASPYAPFASTDRVRVGGVMLFLMEGMPDDEFLVISVRQNSYTFDGRFQPL